MLNERIGSSMERSEMTDEEFEARALYDDYQEDLCKDRRIREGRGWMNEDEEDE